MGKSVYAIFLLLLGLLVSGCSTETEYEVDGFQNYYGNIETSNQKVIYDSVPTWGFFDFKDEKMVNATGSIREEDGEFVMSSGSDPNGYIVLESDEGGSYTASTIIQTAAGIRIEDEAQGNQYVEWGYYNSEDGFGWGHNSSCYLYSFILDNGEKTTECRDEFKINTLPGLNLSKGFVFTNEMVWYGMGPVEFYISERGEDRKGLKPVTYFERPGEMLLVDPSQPYRVEVRNEGTADNMSVYVGGRQISEINGRSEEDQIPVVEGMNDYSVPSDENVWYPVMAMRKKIRYGDSNRLNSVKTQFKGMSVASTENIRYRVTFNSNTADISNYRNVSTWGDSSAAMVKLANETTINVTKVGNTIIEDSLTVSKGSEIRLSEEEEKLVLGRSTEVVLWILRDSNSVPVIDTTLKWQEQR